MIKLFIRLNILVLLLLILTNSIYAQRTVTVYGQLIELKSYVVDKIMPTSEAGKEIISSALKAGGTMALLERKTNKIVLLLPSEANKNLLEALEPYLGITIFIKGKVYNVGGVRVITVEDVGKYLK